MRRRIHFTDCFFNSARNAASRSATYALYPSGSMNGFAWPSFSRGYFLLQYPVVVSMRAEEHVARERLQDTERAFVIVCDLRIQLVVRPACTRHSHSDSRRSRRCTAFPPSIAFIVHVVQPFVWPGVRRAVKTASPSFTSPRRAGRGPPSPVCTENPRCFRTGNFPCRRLRSRERRRPSPCISRRSVP